MFRSGTSKPRVLLTGKTGQIGSELEKLLAPISELSAVDRKQLDLEDHELARDLIRNFKPHMIVNAGAYTAVDQAETEPTKAAAINEEAVRVLAEEAERLGALLIHYSTDYVFDGAKEGSYVESDPTNPLSVYGKTKLGGEQAIRESGCSHLIFRTAWIYAPRGKNFVKTITKLAQERPELRVVNDQHGAPTSASDVANATVRVLEQASIPVRGLYHMTAGGETTWYDIAEEIVTELRRRHRTRATLNAVTTAEYPTLARRPRNSVLSNEQLGNDFGVQMPHWIGSLQVTLNELLAQT